MLDEIYDHVLTCIRHMYTIYYNLLQQKEDISVRYMGQAMTFGKPSSSYSSWTLILRLLRHLVYPVVFMYIV